MLNRTFFASLIMLTSISSAAVDLVFSTGENTLEQQVSAQVIKEAHLKIALNIVVLLYPNMRSLMKSNNGEVEGELARVSHLNTRFKNLLQVPLVINHIDG